MKKLLGMIGSVIVAVSLVAAESGVPTSGNPVVPPDLSTNVTVAKPAATNVVVPSPVVPAVTSMPPAEVVVVVTNTPVAKPAPVPAPADPVPAPVVPSATAPASSNAVTVVAEATSGQTVASPSDVQDVIAIDDVPLLDAVKTLARKSGVNFQFDPKVLAMTNNPAVTINFTNVTALDALDAVLENNGLELVKDPKKPIAKIVVKEPKAEEPLVTVVMQLQYASPTNIAELVQKTLTKRSSVISDPRTGQMIVTTTERELPGLSNIVARLDDPTRQVLIEAQLWETSKNPKTVKGIDWSGTLAAQNVRFGNGNASGTQNESGNSSFTRTTTTPGSSSTDPAGRPTTSSKDVRTTDIMNSAASSVLIGNSLSKGFSANTARGMFPGTAFLDADGLSAVVSFLNTESDTELVSTPRAVVLDNQRATLDVGRGYPIWEINPSSAVSGLGGGAKATWTNMGVTLVVLPRIAANSNIFLKVTPTSTEIIDKDSQSIAGQTYTANIYAARRVETEVMIRSGRTLVLGGLMNVSTYKRYTKVPILGDMPLIGLLFRKDEKRRDKQNLMIFITPTIVGEKDFQDNKPSGFMTNVAPVNLDGSIPDNAWNGGAPYEWTKPRGATNGYVAPAPSRR